MVAKFRFTNEIPKNLTPGVYTTKVISANHTDTGYLIELEFIGEEYNAGNPQCLFPMTKTDLDTDQHFLAGIEKSIVLLNEHERLKLSVLMVRSINTELQGRTKISVPISFLQWLIIKTIEADDEIKSLRRKS